MKSAHFSQLGESAQLARWLRYWLRTTNDDGLKYRCAYYSFQLSDPRLTNTLLSLASDPHEHPVVRGQCLEQLDLCARPRQLKRIERIVLCCLRDPDANVRFWACYASAQHKIQTARSALHDLRDDEGIGDMGWTVGYEATEALKVLKGLEGWTDDRPIGPHPYPELW